MLSLFADGRTTGTVLDCGEGVTHTVPIYEGYAIPFATTQIPICGQDLTNYMYKLLQAKNPTIFSDTSDMLLECEKIKVKFGQVAIDFDAEMKQANEDKKDDD